MNHTFVGVCSVIRSTDDMKIQLEQFYWFLFNGNLSFKRAFYRYRYWWWYSSTILCTGLSAKHEYSVWKTCWSDLSKQKISCWTRRTFFLDDGLGLHAWLYQLASGAQRLSLSSEKRTAHNSSFVIFPFLSSNSGWMVCRPVLSLLGDEVWSELILIIRKACRSKQIKMVA